MQSDAAKDLAPLVQCHIWSDMQMVFREGGSGRHAAGRRFAPQAVSQQDAAYRLARMVPGGPAATPKIAYHARPEVASSPRSFTTPSNVVKLLVSNKARAFNVRGGYCAFTVL